MNSTAQAFAARVDALVEVIAITLDDGTDGDALAGSACLSRYHFQRVFRDATGEPPAAFRRRLLLERAAFQLGETPAEVTQIAFEADYQSLEGFSRAFRRAFGVSPSHYRRLAPQRYLLPAPSGVHYDPKVRRPRRNRPEGENAMDLTDRLIGHDAWMTRRMLERARELTDAQLDMPLSNAQRPLPFDAPESTLRKLLARMIAFKEMWVAAVHGTPLPANSDDSVEGMIKRLDLTFPSFAKIAQSVERENRWEETFVDAGCEPAETFTFGGMIAHVVTFSAFRRVTALKAFEALGVTDLGYGDPIEWERTLAAVQV